MAPNAFWWQWPCNKTFSATRREARQESPGLGFADDELLKQNGVRRCAVGVGSGGHSGQLVANVKRQLGSSPTIGAPRSRNGCSAFSVRDISARAASTLPTERNVLPQQSGRFDPSAARAMWTRYPELVSVANAASTVSGSNAALNVSTQRTTSRPSRGPSASAGMAKRSRRQTGNERRALIPIIFSESRAKNGMRLRRLSKGSDARCIGGIVRQERDQPIAHRIAEFCRAGRQNLDFHARHIDASWALALAGFARDAQLHRFGHVIGAERILPKLAGKREAKRVGAPPRHMHFIAGRPVRRAHCAPFEFAAGAIVVAHLDGPLQAADGAWIGGPIELRPKIVDMIVWRIAEQTAIVKTRSPHDLARIEQTRRIKNVLDLLESPHQLRAEHRLVEFAASQTVAMFPGMRALYARTNSKASSAIARIALTSLSNRKLSTGRTCKHPSEACA